jgi:DNA invertase Pin-like site-specific DNA recombinase
MKPAGKENQMEKTNTCSYIRTSTDREEQEGSFETQKAYFEDLITSDPELEYVGCYGDFGKSGRFADKRPEFQRMLKDCEEGKIQLIYTKSVSRFARSVADFVETVTLLRGLGVLVYFDEENLNTEYRNMELLLHILAIMAAEESRSFGENVRLGLELRASTGHPIGRVAYGYRRVDRDANWAIEEEEAKRVRLAFRMAGAGECYADILKALNQMEKDAGTDVEWKKHRLARMLRNLVYKGDVLTGKTYKVGRVVKKNDGEHPQYYLEQHHAPIVTPELFDRVQMMMDQGLLHTMRCRMTPEQKTFIRDESWRKGQDRLENRGKPVIMEGGYHAG